MSDDVKKKTAPLNLEEFRKKIRKDFGKEALINAEEKESYGKVIPCTSFSLSNATGIGGFAKNKLYTVDGDTGAGKSTTAYDIIGQCQKLYDEPCLLIDKEDSYTRNYGKQLGINNDLLDVSCPHTLEDMYAIVETALRNKIFGVIVVDSVTSFAPEARFNEAAQMGIESRVNSDKMRLIIDALAESNTCLIMIQQIREKIGAFGDPTTVSGGKAIPFYANVRIRITRSEIDRELEQNVMKFTFIKNKLATPFKVGTVVYKWNQGFDFSSEVASLAQEFGIIIKEGSSYILPEMEDMRIVGNKKLITYLNNNPEYTKSVLEPKVIEYLQSTQLRKDEIREEEISH